MAKKTIDFEWDEIEILHVELLTFNLAALDKKLADKKIRPHERAQIIKQRAFMSAQTHEEWFRELVGGSLEGTANIILDQTRNKSKEDADLEYEFETETMKNENALRFKGL